MGESLNNIQQQTSDIKQSIDSKKDLFNQSKESEKSGSKMKI